MSDLIENKDNVISFSLLKIEKGKEKICRCNPPHFEIDTVNRLVTCTDCGAVLDAFDALVTVAGYQDKWSEYQEKAKKQAKIYKELADKEWRRRIQNKMFKDMDKNFREGLYPVCPKCNEIINPMEINTYSRERQDK